METSQGLSVTTSSPKVIESINRFHHEMVASGTNPELILEAVKFHPDNLLLQTYAAAFYLYGQRDSVTIMAKEHLFYAEKLLRDANLREKLIYYATKAWMSRDYANALTLLASITELYPRDTLAAKFAEGIFYCSGQEYHAADYLILCQRMAKENQGDPYFLSMHSFALELAGYLSEAEKVAEKAILLDPITPWAHHTLAHVYLNANHITEGIAKFGAFRDCWKFVLPLLRGHNTWHLALFYLALKQEDQVMALYPSIFGMFPQLVCEHIDAVSLLWRMDIAGMPQISQFTKVAAYFDKAPLEHYTGFNSLHYLYCLTRAGKEDEALKEIASIETYAKSLEKGYTQSLWLNVILPFCKGVYAFAMENFAAAYKYMHPCIGRYTEMGGSDAQAELFAQTYLVCLLKLQKIKEATELFNKYLSHYKGTPLAQFWFNG
jgi:hypothetical protein